MCPQVVALDAPGQNQRVPVRVFNMSAKVIIVKPHTPLCQLQEVNVIRHADPVFESSEDVARKSTQTADENKATLPDGISLENTDLSEDEKEKATHMFQMG